MNSKQFEEDVLGLLSNLMGCPFADLAGSTLNIPGLTAGPLDRSTYLATRDERIVLHVKWW